MTVTTSSWRTAVDEMRREIGRPAVISSISSGTSIPFFGEELVEERRMPDGSVQQMHQVVRTQGTWAVTAAFTPDGELVLVSQYKFGRDDFSLQMAPGGAGRACPPHASDEELIAHVRTAFCRETGMEAEEWKVMQRCPVDDNKYRAPDGVDSFDAHLLLALGAVKVAEVEHNPTDIIRVVLVPQNELNELMRHPDFNEISARLCLYEALRHLKQLHLIA